MSDVTLHLGDCLDVLPTLAAGSVDAVVTDPPYAEIDRPYGRLTEKQWWDLMMGVCREVRRILKPTGSAVFILQSNSEKVGRMRGWLFEFQAWVCREWNMVQDAYWWNFTAPPTVHTHRTQGLMRPSVKACVWAGPENCWRDQEAVLWRESDASKANAFRDRALAYAPSGYSRRQARTAQAAIERGGTTPFNLLPISNSSVSDRDGENGAGTPLELAAWWTRYICPSGGVLLDPFLGGGTMGISAAQQGSSVVGIERNPADFAIAQRRIEQARAQLALPLFAPEQPR